jgi:tetratricopeptide (TPR) repeat protein
MLPAFARFCGNCGQRVLRNFFISYNHADQGWAEWIAWYLEAAGYTTLMQAWDIRPESTFVREMDEAYKLTRSTLVILSPDYLAALSVAPEYGAALRRAPTDSPRPLVSVRVRDCEPEGWLAEVEAVDVLSQPQQEAQKRLLEGIQEEGRPAPPPASPAASAPVYPGMVVPWNVPYRRNPYFSGRDTLLEQVHAAFAVDEPGIVTPALTGLGGSGKTQIALEYAYRYQEEYKAVFWLQAETRDQLLSDVTQLAALLDLPERNESDQARVVAAVRDWLEEEQGWLLVLDNADDMKLVKDVRPTRGSGHVLLTTRAEVLPGTEYDVVQVESLTTEEAARFLLRRAGLLGPGAPLEAASPEQQQAARAIVEEVGGLPLALDLAGAYIQETGCGLSGYLDVYRKMLEEVRSERDKDASVPPEAVVVGCVLALEQTDRRSGASVELLQLCAFLAPEAIPESLVKEDVPFRLVALREAAGDALQWNTTLAALQRFSLLERQSETEMLSQHPLVRAAMQALSADEGKLLAESVISLVGEAFPKLERENWERCQQLLPHALVCAGYIEERHLVSGDAAILLSLAGMYLRSRTRYAESLPLVQQALKIAEQVLESDDSNLAMFLNNLALVHEDQKQYEQALLLYQRALKIREKAYGPDDLSVAESLTDLGFLCSSLKWYEEALLLHQRALKIKEKTSGPDHPGVAQSLTNLARVHYALRQYEEALLLFQRALEILEHALGPNHPRVATCLEELAVVLDDLGRTEEAVPLASRAKAIRAG